MTLTSGRARPTTRDSPAPGTAHSPPPPRGTPPGGSRRLRPSPHTRRPPAGCSSGRGRAESRSPRARGNGTGPFPSSTHIRCGPTARTHANARGTKPRTRDPPDAGRPGQAQRDPPPTQRGEARAAVGERAGARPPPAGSRRTPSLPAFPHGRSTREGGTLAYADIAAGPVAATHTRQGRPTGTPTPHTRHAPSPIARELSSLRAGRTRPSTSHRATQASERHPANGGVCGISKRGAP